MTARARTVRPLKAELHEPAPPVLQPTPWWRHVLLDYRRYQAEGEGSLSRILLSQGFWAACIYRLSRAAVCEARPEFLRGPLRLLAAIAQKLAEVVTGVSLPPECEIGEGLYIKHFGAIVLPRHGRIGHNCSIAQNVTIGPSGKGDGADVPTIGNRVFIGAHSVIVGKITVGEDAVICAGSVVTRSVPPRAVVIGNPARVVSFEGSFDHVVYEGMDFDPDRHVSRRLQ